MKPWIEDAQLEVHPARDKAQDDLFSILIPTWNNLELLELCVDSLRKNSRYRHQIILHINEGNDGTREWAEREGLDYTCSLANIGICYAVNAARTLARTPWLVYFNDDMYACPDWDYWLYEEIKQLNTPLFFLSATMIEPRASGNECVIAPRDYGTSIATFREEALLAEFDSFAKADWSGATWPPNVTSTLLWDLVGGYSVEFSPGMYSDPDFSMKLWHAGVRHFKGVGRSRVYHFMSKSTGKLAIKMDGSLQFLHKWGITSNVFSRHYLRRGSPWTGALREPAKVWSLFLGRARSALKRRLG